MSEKDKSLVEKLSKSASIASEETKMYLLGLADGIAMETGKKPKRKKNKGKQ